MSKSNIILHITFSTKLRINYFYDNIESDLFAYIGGICNEASCPSIIVGGYRNHIHVVCALSRRIAVMDLVEKIKKGSSKWMKKKGTKYCFFQWQKGYAAFSVSAFSMEQLITYIENQKPHHQREPFEDEFIRLLKTNKISFDERYIWD